MIKFTEENNNLIARDQNGNDVPLTDELRGMAKSLDKHKLSETTPMKLEDFIQKVIIPNIHGNEVHLTIDEVISYSMLLDKREMGFWKFSPTGLVYKDKKVIIKND